MQAGDAGPRRLESHVLRQPGIGPELAAKLDWKHFHQARVPLSCGRGRNVEEARRAEERRPRLAAGGGKETERGCAGLCRRRRDAFGQSMGDIALVAGERLVSAVTPERHGDMPPRLFGDQEGRERGLVAERLVEGRCEARQRRRDVFLDLHLLVHGAVP